MKQTNIQETANNEIKELQGADPFFFKRIAMDGPGLNALIQLPDLKILFVNKQFEHYLGYSNDDIEHGPACFTDILEHYQLERFLYQLSAVKESIDYQSRFVIYRLKNKNGKTSFYSLYASPAPDKNGADIPESGLFHLVLHPNQSRWDMPFTSFITKELFLEQFNSEDFGTFEWIISVDKLFWSIGVYRIYEIDDTHMEINSSFGQSFIHPLDKARVEEETNRSIADGSDLNIDYRIITARQNIKAIHCLARPVKNHNGDTVKFAGSIRDITNRRSIEEDLKDKVMELYHSNKELEEFAYIASHDMQEPLRKISIFGERLEEKYKDVLTGDGAMYLSRMMAAAENMRTLIDALLEFSRITKTLQPFELVDLNTILRQVKTDLELVIEETGTTINSQPLPVAEAIATQMKQLFTNIIGNAIKFHKPGVPPVITIGSEILPDAEKLNYELAKNITYYKITVTDNGIGFEDEYSTRIFQVFQRLHGKSEYPGSGIGLAICKKIAEYHKGIIYARNIQGSGACFVFIFPQYQQSPKEKNL